MLRTLFLPEALGPLVLVSAQCPCLATGRRDVLKHKNFPHPSGQSFDARNSRQDLGVSPGH